MAERPSPSFAPSGARARRLDARVHERLAASLAHILERAGDHLPVPGDPAELLARLARGPAPPSVFSAYGELVPAIQADRLDEAAGLLAEIAAAPCGAAPLRVRSIEDPATSPAAARCARLLAQDAPYSVRPPGPAEAHRGRERVHAALGMLQVAEPELADELRALVREVVLVDGGDPRDPRSLGGAAALLLWGAVLVNPRGVEDVPSMARQLAHEGAHALLFGLAADEPLLENPAAERHPSPLRVEPRPLLGIFHATFVLARMHRTSGRLLERGGLEAGARARLAEERRDDARRFADGLATLERHARLTPLGEAVLDGARAYMAGFRNAA